MNDVPAKGLMEEVALELGITPAFVEKDWYVVQLLWIIAGIDLDGANVIFAGGTALAKAHQLLRRFSEDIDFRIVDSELAGLSRSRQRRRLSGLKHAVQGKINESFPDAEMVLKARDENRFFSITFEYETLFERSQALRPHILVEFTLAGLSLPPVTRPVSSFIAALTGKQPEVPAITCLDPVENAVDKLSALIWRVPDRVRSPQDDDPDLVRHIHDLAALYDRAVAHPHFQQLAIAMVAADDDRCGKITGLPLDDKVAILVDTVEGDPEYAAEYERFVQGMSYATETVLSFNEAWQRVKQLAGHLTSLSRNP